MRKITTRIVLNIMHTFSPIRRFVFVLCGMINHEREPPDSKCENTKATHAFLLEDCIRAQRDLWHLVCYKLCVNK